jgi:hypothetical protein
MMLSRSIRSKAVIKGNNLRSKNISINLSIIHSTLLKSSVIDDAMYHSMMIPSFYP